MDKIKILTTGRLAKEFKNSIENEFCRNELTIEYYDNPDQHNIDQYNVLACFNPPKNLDLSNIEWIHSFGAGVNSFLNYSFLTPEVKISRTIGLLAERMAEYCICHILVYNQNVVSNHKNQSRKFWYRSKIQNLYNNSIAILGTGEMGRTIANKLKKMGCKVYGINTKGSQLPEFDQCYCIKEFVSSPPEIDTLISTLPSTAKTVNLMDKDFFKNLSDLHLINVGRGDVIDESFLLKLIDNGVICRATLDVFLNEPLSENSDLWCNDKVFITPHQAAITDVNDILISFREALKAIKNNLESPIFVNLSKGY